MKLVERNTFLGMPIGTVFCKCIDDNVLGIASSIQVLTDVGKCDFSSVDLGCWHPKNNEFAEGWISVCEGNAIEMELSDMRDGLYDKTEKYYIFSKEEVQQMVEALTGALELLK